MLAFEDEAYVRLYTRDTPNWLRLGFEGQAVFALVMRKLDRAGVIDGIEDPVADVALILNALHLRELIAIGMQRLLDSGTLELHGKRLVAPRYVEGQTAVRSDKLRAAELRRRRRDMDRAAEASRAVTQIPPANDSELDDEPENSSRGVTELESPSSDGSDGTPSRAVSAPSRGVTTPPEEQAGSSRDVTSRSDPSRGVTLYCADLISSDLDPPLPPSPAEAGGNASRRSARGGTKGRTKCPEDFEPNEKTLETAWKLGFSRELELRTRVAFVNWWRGDGRLKADWQATYRNRLVTVADQRGLKPPKHDDRWRKYQDDKRRAEAPVKPAAPPADFERKAGSLFA